MNEIEMLRRFRHGPRTGSKDRLGQRHHLVGIRGRVMACNKGSQGIVS